MSEILSSQDWYRVRRGEDQIAWGRAFRLIDDRKVRLSYRASQEFGFLDDGQRNALLQALHAVTVGREPAAAVLDGDERRLIRAAGLRAVFRYAADGAGIEVATIRDGAVLDPESVGRPPCADLNTYFHDYREMEV